jgi:mono/diheme cytochrome c family protein
MQQRVFFVLTVIIAAAAWALAVHMQAAHAQTKPAAGDPAAGRSLALRACTGCHIVAPDQPFKPVFTGPPHPPDFKDIANAPNVTAAALQRHLASLPAVPQRPGMANPVLTSAQLRDVSAFIVSLREKPVAPGQ